MALNLSLLVSSEEIIWAQEEIRELHTQEEILGLPTQKTHNSRTWQKGKHLHQGERTQEIKPACTLILDH